MIDAVQKLVRRAGPPSASVIAAATNPHSDKFIGVRPKQVRPVSFRKLEHIIQPGIILKANVLTWFQSESKHYDLFSF